MNTFSLILRIAALAGALAAGAGWFLTHGKLGDMSTQLAATNAKLSATTVDLANTRDNLAAVETSLKDARTELAEQKIKVTQSQNQLFASTQEVNRLQTALEAETRKATQLSQDNDLLKREILAVKSAPPPDIDNTEEVIGYKNKIAEMEKEISDLQRRLASAPPASAPVFAGMASTSSGGPSPANPFPTPAGLSAPATPAGPASHGSLSALIAGLSRENGLLVLNRGYAAGIRRDTEYALLKNGEEIGRFRATNVEDGASAGPLLGDLSRLLNLRIGDSVILVQ